MEDYQALGRLQGAQDAQIGMEACIMKDAAYRDAWNNARLAAMEEKARALMAEGATLEQAQAYASEAERRFGETCIEIRLVMEQRLDEIAAAASQPSPTWRTLQPRSRCGFGPRR